MLDLLIVRRRQGFNILAKTETGKKWIADHILTLNPEVVFINGDHQDMEDYVKKIEEADIRVEVL